MFLGVVEHLLKGPTVMREAEVQATVTLAAKGGGLLRCTEGNACPTPHARRDVLLPLLGPTCSLTVSVPFL